MSNFDEKSGIIACKTDWGSWWQTMEEINIEINTGEPISAKVVKCEIKPKQLKVSVNGKVLIDVSLERYFWISTCIYNASLAVHMFL